ncbi:probable polygalacturonase At3g15720 [Rosa rugosa]|uniref:probable polygalacturonase At3g15720 n=1 Tax=Rosa rugosa TaxID=74645 RepID=UPI002B4182A2|nr:probable polygalacturonase At3g15720 [Rosa rugosa]
MALLMCEILAFLEAWQRACGAVGETQTLNIPKWRKYKVKPVRFDGPCKSDNIVIQVDGSIESPSTIGEWTGCESGSWLEFQNVKGLTIKGAGVIDGKGSIWWSHKPRITSYTTGTNCTAAPTALRWRYCDQLALSGFTSLNSPNKHILIHGSNGVDISSVHVNAPQHSPNTDGIVLSGSTRVNIFDSVFKTGDDCIALKSGCSVVNITRVACGPGHVGGTYSGNGEIKVSDITFRGFQGTSASDAAIRLECSNLWCTNIVMDHVNISSMIPGKPTYSYCENVKGRSRFTTPAVPCLEKQ